MLSFTDLVNINFYIAGFLLAGLGGIITARKITLNDNTTSNLIGIYGGLLTAQGVVTGFTLSANESMLKFISDPSFNLLKDNLRTIKAMHTFTEGLNYLGLAGIIVIVSASFTLIRNKNKVHKWLLAAGVSLFFMESLSVIMTYSLIHKLRLMSMAIK